MTGVRAAGIALLKIRVCWSSHEMEVEAMNCDAGRALRVATGGNDAGRTECILSEEWRAPRLSYYYPFTPWVMIAGYGIGQWRRRASDVYRMSSRRQTMFSRRSISTRWYRRLLPRLANEQSFLTCIYYSTLPRDGRNDSHGDGRRRVADSPARDRQNRWVGTRAEGVRPSSIRACCALKFRSTSYQTRR